MAMFNIQTIFQQQMGDFITPVAMYASVRQRYAESVLFESSEYGDKENHYSFICYEPLFDLEVSTRFVTLLQRGKPVMRLAITEENPLSDILNSIFLRFEYDTTLPEIMQPFFGGYIQYDAVQLLDKLEIGNGGIENFEPPLIRFTLFQTIIIFDHYHQIMYRVRHFAGNERPGHSADSINLSIPADDYSFSVIGKEVSGFDRAELRKLISDIKQHVYRGDVFQIVPSCGFAQQFRGDAFTVYRQLRSINPSPYLYFCDYGSFNLFGSSPEAQLKIKNGRAVIHPIAGTVQRSGDLQKDNRSIESLLKSDKENAEHVMLVDLARNDLSRNGSNVRVDKFREVQYYSHVIHLVSEVSGSVRAAPGPWNIIFDTFPAGTLTGAPKFRSIQLIEQYESTRRYFYGGAVGMVFLNGNVNLAIVIRSALAVRNQLYFQAGAGIVADSDPLSEVDEIYHKTNSMRTAIQRASIKEAAYV